MISICITTLNEEGSVGRLLDSLITQSKKPNEIVIVDGGSKDKTVEIIRHYQKRFKGIRFLPEKGSIAHGRNVAIDLAKGDIIVQTDCGCVAKKDWLEKITRPFTQDNVGVVAGFYEMPANSPLQEVINVFHGIPPQRFDPKTFIPSARSVAFRKAVWEKIGGYSEKLPRAGEDTLFFYETVKNNFRIERVGDAKVIWEETRNMPFALSLKKFFNYAKGDYKTGIWWDPNKQLASHNIKISFVFIRYLIALSLLIVTLLGHFPTPALIILVFLYLFWAIYKWRDVIKDWQGRALLPAVQITVDFAVMGGFLTGIFFKNA